MEPQINTSEDKHKSDIKKRYKDLISKWGNSNSGNKAYFRLTAVLLVLIALPLVVSLSLNQQNIRQNASVSLVCDNGLVCTACSGAATGTCGFGNGKQSCTYTSALSGLPCNPKTIADVYCHVGCASGSTCNSSNVCIAGTNPTPTPTPTKAPIPTPTKTTTPPANCPSSLQSAINSAATGSTLNVTGCTFKEAVTINKSMTLMGGKIDGQNSRSTAIRISAANVTISGTEVLNHTTAFQQGAIDADNQNGVKLINVHSHNNTGPGFSLSGGSGHRVTGGEYDHNAQEGYHMTGVSDVVMDGVRVDNNNLKVNGAYPSDPGWEAGAGKITASNGVTIQNCIVYNNGGVGIWFDIDGNNTKILNNYSYNNDYAGIMFEISNNAVISGNKVWNNGIGDNRGWGWPANILIASSKSVEVANNTVGNGTTGISLISQNRENGYTAMSNIYVHDNAILSQSSGKLIGWYDDHNGGSFNDTSNRGSNGLYEGPDGNKFEWNNSTTNLAGFNATRADENGRFLTTAEISAKKALLVAQ